MTDREMLELAAKAAKLSVFWGHPSSDCYDHNKLYLKQDKVVYTAREWNPLTDDGDAFRLMVDLRITVNFTECACCVSTYANQLDEDGPDFCIRHSKKYDDCETTDPFVAARLAIVRTATEIGRNMK